MESGITPTEISREMLARLSGALRLHGVSQRQIATEMGVSDATVSRWINGETPIPLRALIHMAERAKLDPGQLLSSNTLAEAPGAPSKDSQSSAQIPAPVSQSIDRSAAANAEYVDIAARPRRLLLEWGACGVPSPVDGVIPFNGAERDDQHETTPLPEGEEVERLIGPKGYAVRVRGQSMAAWGLKEGDLVWVNPQAGKGSAYNQPVLARLLDIDGSDLGMTVKVLHMDDQGKEFLQSDGDGDATRFYRFEFFAAAVRHQPRDRPLMRSTANAGVAAGNDFARPGLLRRDVPVDEQRRAG